MKSAENEAVKIAAELPLMLGVSGARGLWCWGSLMLGLSWGDHKWGMPRAVFEDAWFAVRRECKGEEGETGRAARIRQRGGL